MGQSKKAQKELRDARQAVRIDDFELAWKHISKALKYDPDYVDANIMAGDFNLSAKRPGDVELLESFLAETGFEIILHHGKDLIMAQDILLEGADVFENESLSDHSRLVALI